MTARRWVAPAALGIAALVSAAVALQTPAIQAPNRTIAPKPKAAVLSVRRAPDLLTRTIADGNLSRQLDSVLRDRAVANSCLVVEQDDRLLYNRNPDRPLIPASNLKILTALAALSKIGPDERFSTTAKATSPIGPDGTLNATLHLVGGGDPILMTADYLATAKHPTQIRTPFEQLADDLVAKGLKRLTKGISGDESRFDRQRYIPTWKPNYAADGEVGPQAALLVNDGFAAFKPRRVAAANPAAHAAGVLADLLRSRGVLIEGASGQSHAPAGAATLSELRSPPVRDVVAQMLKESDNTTAELLTKELGRRTAGQGTTSAGLAAIRQTLLDANLDVAQLKTADGSGLDRSDQATCGLLVAALDETSAMKDALPIAAKDGTLDDRFHGHPAAGRLRAKTGSLQGVAGLSGFMDNSIGPALTFSLLANDLPREATGRALQESVAAVLARYPDAPNPDELDP